MKKVKFIKRNILSLILVSSLFLIISGIYYIYFIIPSNSDIKEHGIIDEHEEILLDQNINSSEGMQMISDYEGVEFSLIDHYVQTEIIFDSKSSSSSANQILQTSDKYMWFATYNGLIRYDGNSYKTYTSFTDDDFKGNSARVLYEDSSKKLWIGTSEFGIALFENKKFSMLKKGDELSTVLIRDIAEDKQGRIIVATPKGLFTIHIGNDGELESQQLHHSSVLKIEIGNNDLLYGILNDGEFRVFKNQEWVLPDGVKNYIQQNNEDIAYVNNELWLSSSEGKLIKLDNNNKWVSYDRSELLGGNFYSGIFEDSDGNIWFSSDTGIDFYDSKKQKFITLNTDGLIVNSEIQSICKDHEGNIWISSSRSGVMKLSLSKFKGLTKRQGLANSVVNSINRDGEILYVGTDSGLIIFNNGKLIENELTKLLEEQRIRHIMKDSLGAYWISTYGEYGVVEYKNGKINVYNEDNGLTYYKTRVSMEDSNGDIWVGTKDGLNKISNGKIVETFTEAEGLTNTYVLSLYESDNGDIYVGTDGGGIFIITSEGINNITDKEGLAGNIIFRMIEDDEGVIWVTSSKGISIIENEKIDAVETMSILGIPSVFQLIIDANDLVWLGTSNGIYQVSKKQLLDVIYNENAEISLEFLSEEEGLMGGITALSFSQIDNYGNIEFCTTQGVFSIDSNDITDNQLIPPMIITNVSIDGHNILEPTSIIMNTNSKRINIYFTALSYINPEEIKFVYRLKGYEDEWSGPTTIRNISYTNLHGGKYVFELKVGNNDGIWSQNTQELVIEKELHYTERISFWIIICIISIVILYFIYHIRIKQMKDRQAILKKVVIESTICLTNAIDAKDHRTEGHSERVAEYALIIAKEMNLNEELCEKIEISALLHDIGKIGVPDKILLSDRKLTNEEFDKVKEHPEIGWKILEGSKSIKQYSDAARYHHERFDGTGYNHQLKGSEIPLEARIISVADAYDAMSSDRRYRQRLTNEDVIKELLKGRGTQFDTYIVNCLLKVIEPSALDNDCDVILCSSQFVSK